MLTQIEIPDKMDSRLSALAQEKGMKKEDLILEAVEKLVHNELTAEAILAKRRRAFGIWKDRTDLPDFVALRKSMDRKLNWDDAR
ncbi:MAG: CopG family transcriptional regulator [Ignavibacteriota bacterium]